MVVHSPSRKEDSRFSLLNVFRLDMSCSNANTWFSTLLLFSLCFSASLMKHVSAEHRPGVNVLMQSLGMGKPIPFNQEQGWPRFLPVYEAGKTVTMKKALDAPSGYHFNRDSEDIQRTLKNYQALNRYNSIKQLMFGR
ncbi:hypothetical protein L596_010969 [Steinernema carpocapsae]|uniref:Uncharacterized protein n=1 Tax=Steinernema carpocapsae TaxID=34508 RepID=A0A4U5NTB8_STECR|nr:hypothetical protein L596_010969 [Steinernema carpocapsae]